MAKLASRYALALFQLAKERDALDTFYDQVKVMREVMLEDEEIHEFINNPRLSSEDKFRVFEGIFKGKAEPELLGFLSVIFNKNREKELGFIFDAFLEEVLEDKGIANAYIESAVPLKASQLEEIKTKLSEKLNKQIVIKSKVVPELIGGVKITACGYVIDGTVRKGLDELKTLMLENRFA